MCFLSVVDDVEELGEPSGAVHRAEGALDQLLLVLQQTASADFRFFSDVCESEHGCKSDTDRQRVLVLIREISKLELAAISVQDLPRGVGSH